MRRLLVIVLGVGLGALTLQSCSSPAQSTRQLSPDPSIATPLSTTRMPLTTTSSSAAAAVGPAPVPASTANSAVSPSTVAGTRSTGAATASSTGVPAAPAKQGGITHPAWGSDEYSLPASDTQLEEIAATGATWVQLVPTWYQRSRTASTFAADASDTVSDDGLRHAIRKAHGLGLRVLLKPHVDLPDDGDRARIRPDDPAQWFAAYRRFIGHYATIAAQEGVEQLCVGTELTGTMSMDAEWRSVITEVRRLYGGPLTYAANFDAYDRVPFWSALDSIGIDAYFPLHASDPQDAAQLVSAWAPIAAKIKAFAAQQGKPVTFTEAGYTSQRGTTAAPYDWTISRTRDDREQAAAYQALMDTFWAEPWFTGVFWWMWDDLPGRSSEDQRLDYTPHGKAAEEVLRRFWRR